jgi:hypothetical protein
MFGLLLDYSRARYVFSRCDLMGLMSLVLIDRNSGKPIGTTRLQCTQSAL